MTICNARAVGLMSMVDHGQADHKIIAVLCEDPIYSEFARASDFPKHIFKMLKRFFEDYKQLEGKEVAVEEILPAEAAYEIVEDALARYWRARRVGEIKGLVS
jgi:inorganic pyrophosphatase